ncbi:MAG: asparagine synthase (glutamine-hydrolyzing) [Planctomycetaceae bacterium]
MCGIYGVLALNREPPLDVADLRGMAGVTVHRGPDDEGCFRSGPIAFGMRRLSILDLSGGHQPIGNEDGSIQVVCNGEIYNYREVTAELVARGHRFKTRSDSEILVHLYEEHGTDLVHRLNGMYAFALWDGRCQRLVLGRDRLGIKPLYYRHDGKTLLFASEAKAILAVPGVRAELDPYALREYLALGYVPGPLSMFRGIRKLPPASLLVVEGGEVKQQRWWSPREAVGESLCGKEWADTLLATMETAVQSQMVSDVPLGAFLSGGVDSSAVVAMMARRSDRPVQTYSIGFEESGGGAYYNELPWAREVAQLFGTEHREIIVKPDVASLLPRLLWHMDEPVADSAFVTTYLVAEFARRDVTVILSGVGGDELFGGYRRYLGGYYDRYLKLIPGWIRRSMLQPIARALPSDRHSPLLNLSRYVRGYLSSSELSFEDRYRSYVEVFARKAVDDLLVEPVEEPFDALGTAFVEAGGGDEIGRMSRVDLLTQLPDDLLLLTDRMTMATSLECRVPFLDDTVVDLSLRMPSHEKVRGRRLKHVLKRALSGLLPERLLHRKKRGFGAPMGAWLKGALAPLMRGLLSERSLGSRGLVRPEAVRRAIELHTSNREDHSDHLQSLLHLEIWARLYLDGRTPASLAAELEEIAAQ